MSYKDSTGHCSQAFGNSARVYALHSRTNDTLYTYGFNDSCHVGFLVADSVVYHLVNTGFGVDDVIRLGEVEYQDPVNVTECCLCYPLHHIHTMLNGQEISVEFPAGVYESTPVVRTY